MVLREWRLGIQLRRASLEGEGCLPFENGINHGPEGQEVGLLLEISTLANASR